MHPTSREGFVFLLGSVLLAVYSLVLHALSNAKWKMSPYLFPLVIAVFLFLLSLSLLQEGKKERQTRDEREPEGQKLTSKIIFPQKVGEQVGSEKATNVKRLSLFFASLLKKTTNDALVFAFVSLVYVMSIGLVGFVVATALFLAVSFVLLKERRVWLVIVLSIAFPLIVYLLFGMLLHVMLP